MKNRESRILNCTPTTRRAEKTRAGRSSCVSIDVRPDSSILRRIAKARHKNSGPQRSLCQRDYLWEEIDVRCIISAQHTRAARLTNYEARPLCLPIAGSLFSFCQQPFSRPLKLSVELVHPELFLPEIPAFARHLHYLKSDSGQWYRQEFLLWKEMALTPKSTEFPFATSITQWQLRSAHIPSHHFQFNDPTSDDNRTVTGNWTWTRTFRDLLTMTWIMSRGHRFQGGHWRHSSRARPRAGPR